MSKLYISDLHLGHKNAIMHDNRPFANLDEMHSSIITNWNDVVKEEDEVYILGDFAWKKSVANKILPQLKENKFLVRGNHDKINDEMRAHFVLIKNYSIITDGETELVLSHYPIAHWYNQYRGAVHLYGYVHNTKDYKAYLQYSDICSKMGIPFESYNVGCMLPYMGYTPRILEDIRRSIK